MKFCTKLLALSLVLVMLGTQIVSCAFSWNRTEETPGNTDTNDNIVVIPPVNNDGGNNGNNGNNNDSNNDSNNNDNNGNTEGSVVVGNATAPYIADVHVSASVTPDENNQVPSEGVNLDSSLASAVIPGGVEMEAGATELALTINGIDESAADVTLSDTEISNSLDVHVSGVAASNLVPMEIKLAAAALKGLNSTSIKLYHVENGVTIEMTYVPSDAEFTAHNQFKYDPVTGDVTLYIASFSEIMMVSDTENAWEGGVDHTWYNASAENLYIASAEQLWSFSQIVGGMAEGIEQDSFEGKTVTLIADINLGDDEANNVEGKIFYPIGYNSDDGLYGKTGVAVSTGFYSFMGTFDGNGHTISNFYQNTWEMKGDHNWYDATLQYYRDGMGLFGKIYKGTVKNLTVENFSSDGEITTTGVIAAYAEGATFENISIFNCNPRVYNIGNGGIVGCVGWYAKEAGLKTSFTNITVDNTNKISALWGSYDVACGGIVGQYYPTSGQTSAGTPKNGGVHFENCHVSAQMDVYNDVCANYQYYAYRYTGMLIGSVRENETIDGHVYPKMDGITASGCTVHFGTWNDYYYCEIIDNTTASYTHDYQMSRLTEIKAIEGTTITYLDGSKGTVPATGRANYVIVDYTKGHGTENATCYHFKDGVVWNHEDGGYEEKDIDGDGIIDSNILKEDKNHIYLEFNNLVTGYGWGVTTKVVGDLDGVVILDREVGDSIDKFEVIGTGNALQPSTGSTIDIGTLFGIKDQTEVALLNKNVIVSVTPLGENSTVRGTYAINEIDWTKGTLALSGVGLARVTITDYYFCNPTSVIIDVQPIDKFVSKFTNTNFTYRVGNQSTIALGSLFGALGNLNVPIDSESVNVTVEGTDKYTFTTNTSDWTKATIDFSGFVGTVTITIKDATSTNCSATVDVINAINATGATNATSNNVVLLNDAGFGSLEISGGYTLFGNGFTMTCASDSAALDMGYAFVTLNSGTLDNVQIVCPNFDYAVLYKSNMTESGNRSETTDKTRYFNVKSGVMVSGNSQILNSRISGARAAVNVASGNCIIDNSRIEGGAVSSILVGAANSVTLRDITLVQKPTASTYDSSKILMGFSVLVICNSDGDAAPITLEGKLVQNAWVNSEYKQYVPSAGQSIVSLVLNNTNYIHEFDLDDDGETEQSVNLGFAYMPETQGGAINSSSIAEYDNRSNKSDIPYQISSVKNVSTTFAEVYSYLKTDGTNIYETNNDFINTPTYTPNKYSDIIEIGYSDTQDGLTTGKSFGTNGWVYELNVDLDKLPDYALDLSKLAMFVNGVAVTDYKVDRNAKPASIVVTAGGKTYELTATINGKAYTAYYKITGTETTKDSPSLVTNNYEAALLVGTQGSRLGNKDTWHGAAPVLEGIQIRYWSVAEKQYKTINLSNYTPTTAGKQNGTEAVWTYTPDNGDFTLTIKNETAVHSSNNVYAMPVVVNNKLYFVPSASNGLVNYGNSARTIKINYYFNDNNNGTQLKFDYTWSIECPDGALCYTYSSFIEGTQSTFNISSSNGSGCVTPDTLITLADGTQKEIQHLALGDMVLAWNFYTGKYEVMPVSLLQAHDTGILNVLHLYFEDGTELKLIGEHGVFDADLNTFVFIDEYDVENYIGHNFVKQDGDSFTTVKLVGYDVVAEHTTAYTILSADHYNVLAEGMFTVTPAHVGDNFFNPFDIGEDMKYDEEAVKADIEKYGLYTYEDFDHVLTYEQFVALNLGHFKVSVGKGYITYEGLIYLIENFINNEDFNVK